MRKYSEEKKETLSYNDLLARKEKEALVATVWAIIATFFCFIFVVIILIIASYPKSQGYVIEITPDGQATMDMDAVTLLEDWTPKDATINYFLRNFITSLRSVSSDTQVNSKNVQNLYKLILGGSVAEEKAKAYLESEARPNERAKTETVQIMISSILPITDNTYQIDFRETVWANGRRLTSDSHYRAIIHTELYTPRTLEQRSFNPIGLYVTDFNISLVKDI